MSGGFQALLAGIADSAPDRPVLGDAQGDIGAAQLVAWVAQLANWLRDEKVRVAASCLDNGRHALAFDLALHCAGRTHLPLPPYFSPAQRLHALDEAGADCLLADPGMPMPEGWQSSPPPCDLQSLALWRRAAPASRLPPGCAVVSYTSGSTGTPQGICLDAASLLRTAGALQSAFASIALQRHLCALPLSTLLESIGVYAALARGCSVQLPPLASLGYSGASRLDSVALFDTIQRFRPDSLILVPQLLAGWLGQVAAHPDSAHRASLVAVGGAKVPASLLARAELLGVPVYEGYGLSEASSVVALNRPDARRPGSVGKPLPHIQLRIADDGEIWLRGQAPLARPGQQSAADSGGWWASGDLGRLDQDGYLNLHGRKRSVFITAFGRNVSPEWIEAELQDLPGVSQLLVHGEGLAENLALATGDPVLYAASDGDRQLAAINLGLPDYARVARLLWTPDSWSVANGLATGNGRPRREAILDRYAALLAPPSPADSMTSSPLLSSLAPQGTTP